MAFARELGVVGADTCRFLAPDGVHGAEILSQGRGEWIVRLGMRDVREAVNMRAADAEGWFMDTGARHFVVTDPGMCGELESLDVEQKGGLLRWDDAFAPMGTNVDFVRLNPDGSLSVRTFEKGVEGETLACGTGITASAIAAHLQWGTGTHCLLHAREADLSVDFTQDGHGARAVFLSGPVTKI